MHDATHTHAENDAHFTEQELTQVISTKKDTAPEQDKIPYSFLSH